MDQQNLFHPDRVDTLYREIAMGIYKFWTNCRDSLKTGTRDNLQFVRVVLDHLLLGLSPSTDLLFAFQPANLFAAKPSQLSDWIIGSTRTGILQFEPDGHTEGWLRFGLFRVNCDGERDDSFVQCFRQLEKFLEEVQPGATDQLTEDMAKVLNHARNRFFHSDGDGAQEARPRIVPSEDVREVTRVFEQVTKSVWDVARKQNPDVQLVMPGPRTTPEETDAPIFRVDGSGRFVALHDHSGVSRVPSDPKSEQARRVRAQTIRQAVRTGLAVCRSESRDTCFLAVPCHFVGAPWIVICQALPGGATDPRLWAFWAYQKISQSGLFDALREEARASLSETMSRLWRRAIRGTEVHDQFSLKYTINRLWNRLRYVFPSFPVVKVEEKEPALRPWPFDLDWHLEPSFRSTEHPKKLTIRNDPVTPDRIPWPDSDQRFFAHLKTQAKHSQLGRQHDVLQDLLNYTAEGETSGVHVLVAPGASGKSNFFDTLNRNPHLLFPDGTVPRDSVVTDSTRRTCESCGLGIPDNERHLARHSVAPFTHDALALAFKMVPADLSRFLINDVKREPQASYGLPDVESILTVVGEKHLPGFAPDFLISTLSLRLPIICHRCHSHLPRPRVVLVRHEDNVGFDRWLERLDKRLNGRHSFFGGKGTRIFKLAEELEVDPDELVGICREVDISTTSRGSITGIQKDLVTDYYKARSNAEAFEDDPPYRLQWFPSAFRKILARASESLLENGKLYLIIDNFEPAFSQVGAITAECAHKTLFEKPPEGVFILLGARWRGDHDQQPWIRHWPLLSQKGTGESAVHPEWLSLIDSDHRSEGVAQWIKKAVVGEPGGRQRLVDWRDLFPLPVTQLGGTSFLKVRSREEVEKWARQYLEEQDGLAIVDKLSPGSRSEDADYVHVVEHHDERIYLKLIIENQKPLQSSDDSLSGFPEPEPRVLFELQNRVATDLVNRLLTKKENHLGRSRIDLLHVYWDLKSDAPEHEWSKRAVPVAIPSILIDNLQDSFDESVLSHRQNVQLIEVRNKFHHQIKNSLGSLLSELGTPADGALRDSTEAKRMWDQFPLRTQAYLLDLYASVRSAGRQDPVAASLRILPIDISFEDLINICCQLALQRCLENPEKAVRDLGVKLVIADNQVDFLENELNFTLPDQAELAPFVSEFKTEAFYRLFTTCFAQAIYHTVKAKAIKLDVTKCPPKLVIRGNRPSTFDGKSGGPFTVLSVETFNPGEEQQDPNSRSNSQEEVKGIASDYKDIQIALGPVYESEHSGWHTWFELPLSDGENV